MKASDRYLGLPSSQGRSKRALMACLREDVFNKNDGSKSKFLSLEGKRSWSNRLQWQCRLMPCLFPSSEKLL